MKRWYWLMLIAMSIVLSMSLVFACGDDDDDDDDDDTEDDDDFFDDDAADDDATDDDSADDDAADDDATDDDADDDDAVGAPVLVDSYWDPATFDMVVDCTDDQTPDPCTALIWEVCDEDGNLSGGQIYVYVAGTSTPAFGGDMLWDDFLTGDPIDDCDNPFATGIGVYFDGTLDDWCPEAGESYFIGVDVEVSDGDGNFSNMITDVEVVWNCA